MAPWWKLTFIPTVLPHPHEVSDLLDDLGCELIELGALSTSIESPPDISCFMKCTESERDDFLASVPTDRLRLLQCAEVTEENWSEGCPEVWAPIQAGQIEIVPVSSEHDPRPYSSSAIRIIPGQGFGTGHHATTRMILEEMSDLALSADALPSKILDVGTGSGILAIAAARLFKGHVDANDIDDDALRNASDNIALNGVGSWVSLSLEPVSSFGGPYNLILANVYGEVLVSLEHELTRLSAPGTIAFLSGVTETVKDPVIAAYTKGNAWTLERERSDGDWMCLCLRRT